MSAKSVAKTYLAQARLTNLVTVEVHARSLDDALIVAQELHADDFITVDGEPLDGSFELTGIYSAE
jgi:hypothetical protein